MFLDASSFSLANVLGKLTQDQLSPEQRTEGIDTTRNEHSWAGRPKKNSTRARREYNSQRARYSDCGLSLRGTQLSFVFPLKKKLSFVSKKKNSHLSKRKKRLLFVILFSYLLPLSIALLRVFPLKSPPSPSPPPALLVGAEGREASAPSLLCTWR